MYSLFAGSNFYPLGGIKDFIGFFDSIEETKTYIEELYKRDSFMWAHIVLENTIMCEGRKDCDGKLNEFWHWE